MTDEPANSTDPKPNDQQAPQQALIPSVNPTMTPTDTLAEIISDPESYIEKYGGEKVKEMMDREKKQQLEIAQHNAQVLLSMAEAIDKRFQSVENNQMKIIRDLDLIKRVLKNAAENGEIIKDITIKTVDIRDENKKLISIGDGQIVRDKIGVK